MRAIIVRTTGGPEVLELADLPTPEPGPGQVRVDVAAAGVNFVDVYHRIGLYPMPRPYTAGVEAAGVISAVGDGVTEFAVGDRVAWLNTPGGYAEQAVVPATSVVPVPDPVPAETAAAALLQGITAHYLTRSTYPVRAGDAILVHAAAGGMGLLLTQLGKAFGARVIGTASTPEKAALAREAGADVVVGYADALDAVREVTGGRGVDVAYDGVGRDTFATSLAALRPRGVLASYGNASGPVDPVAPLELRHSVFLTRPTLADHIASREELTYRAGELFGWLSDGTLRVVAAHRYDLADARRAHEDLEARRTTGKVLLLP